MRSIGIKISGSEFLLQEDGLSSSTERKLIDVINYMQGTQVCIKRTSLKTQMRGLQTIYARPWKSRFDQQVANFDPRKGNGNPRECRIFQVKLYYWIRVNLPATTTSTNDSADALSKLRITGVPYVCRGLQPNDLICTSYWMWGLHSKNRRGYCMKREYYDTREECFQGKRF